MLPKSKQYNADTRSCENRDLESLGNGQPKQSVNVSRSEPASYLRDGDWVIYFIMPVGSDPMYRERREALRHILRGRGKIGHFPLEHNENTELNLDSIIADMNSADQVVADLALERPSCYFEVGLAQALGKRVRLIAPIGTDVHQVGERELVERYDCFDEYKSIIDKIISES
jgi:nucleoside 2-deoxyribosyltransferase